MAARAAPRVPAATGAAFNRFSVLTGFSVAVLGGVALALGIRPTSDQSQQGISNTTIIVVSIVGFAIAWTLSRKK